MDKIWPAITPAITAAGLASRIFWITRRKYSAEEIIRIVLEGLRGEDSMAELCRREGINANVYICRSKEFMESGKKRLAGAMVRDTTSSEVEALRAEVAAFKEVLADHVMENRLLKKRDGFPHDRVTALPRTFAH